MNHQQKLQRYQHLAERFKSSVTTGEPVISEAESEERIRLHYELNIGGAAEVMKACANLPIDIEISSSIGHGMTMRRHLKGKGQQNSTSE